MASRCVPARARGSSAGHGGGGNCDPNFQGTCVPSVAYDLDCSDISGSVTVVGEDEHAFDGDGNGYGCESNA